MATIRVRVELQRSSKGIEMAKLAKLSEESQKLFRMVANDVGVDNDLGTWVAVDFYNQGIGFDAEYQLAEVDFQQAAAYVRAIDLISNTEPMWKIPGVRSETLVQCARVASLAQTGETVRLGILDDAVGVKWKPLSKERAVAILDHFESWIEYRGMLQGVIHALYKESSPPFFSLRDLASRALVKCMYDQKDYARVYRSLERKDAIVLVSGWIKAKRLDRTIEQMRVEKIEPTKPLHVDQLKEFFGSTPGWTGDLTSDEFIDIVRQDRDGDE